MKSRTFTGTPTTHAKVNNTSGWRHRSLGTDTIPGAGVGAPLVNTQHSDDSVVKSVNYADGINPYGMTPHAASLGVLGGRSDDAPARDSMARGPRAHPDLMTKDDNAAVAEHEIGNVPHGTMGR